MLPLRLTTNSDHYHLPVSQGACFRVASPSLQTIPCCILCPSEGSISLPTRGSIVRWWVLCKVCLFSRSVVSNSCDPMDCSPPGSSVHGISRARILEQVAISFSRESSQARDQTWVSYIACTGDGGLGWVSLPLAPPGNSQQKWGAVKDSFSS